MKQYRNNKNQKMEKTRYFPAHYANQTKGFMN